jgi:hypothetical protein
MAISRAFVVIGTLFLAAAPFEAAPARADTVFNFSGICDAGCTGTATGILTLVDFFDDDNGMVDAATFISFAYSSSSGSFLITLADGGSASGLLYDDGRPFGGLVVSSSAGLPSFQATPEEFDAATGASTDDVGSSFTFVQVSGAIPEPPTWAMMLLGFAGLGYAGYRKARSVSVAGV